MSVALLINALTYASMLVLMAEAHTLTYLTSDAFNLTVGPIAAIGAYLAFTLTRILGLQLYLSLPAAFVVCSIAGVICQALVVEPMLRRGRGPVLLTLALIGAGILLTALIKIYAHRLQSAVGIWTNTFMLYGYDFKVGWVQGIFIASTALAFASVLLHERLFNDTLLGASMRAVVENADLAMVQGVNPARVRLLSWALAGGLAGLAGAYGSVWFRGSTDMGSALMTGVLAACLLGGVTSIRGSAVGGLIMGVLENVSVVWGQRVFGTWIGEYRPIVPIAVIAITMLLMPQGLLGFKRSNKSNKALELLVDLHDRVLRSRKFELLPRSGDVHYSLLRD